MQGAKSALNKGNHSSHPWLNKQAGLHKKKSASWYVCRNLDSGSEEISLISLFCFKKQAGIQERQLHTRIQGVFVRGEGGGGGGPDQSDKKSSDNVFFSSQLILLKSNG